MALVEQLGDNCPSLYGFLKFYFLDKVSIEGLENFVHDVCVLSGMFLVVFCFFRFLRTKKCLS